ncbi:hypothetical protein CP973_08035 [Streptomyces albofaciens JCM 4342]|nr:hypothetical protein [Streptomyces albofaciens]KAA6221914.1 hypothetical protein CP973_08035 [Streptomyces albofaciens JCM 4342]
MRERVPGGYAPGEGCLTRLVRVPVRVVVLVVVVPVRMVWDVLVAGARALDRGLLRPVGRGFAWLGRVLVVVPSTWVYRWVLTPVGHGIAWVVWAFGAALAWVGKAVFYWPWAALWRYVLVPVGTAVGVAVAWLVHQLVVVPALWGYRRVLTPVGHAVRWVFRGLGAGLAWLVLRLVVLPARWCYRHVLTPVGHGIVRVVRGIGAAVAALVRWTLVVPAVAVWRYVLAPAGRAVGAAAAVVARETGAAFGHAWRVAGYVSRAVGRFLGTLLRWIFVEPFRWVHRAVLTPVGHAVRDVLWRPVRAAAREAGRSVRRALGAARQSVRQTRAEVRRALFGSPKRPEPAAVPEPRREQAVPAARTLGKTSGRDVSPSTRGPGLGDAG